MKINHFARQLETTYHGPAWFGDSLRQKLDTVRAEEAFAVPLPGLHSVAQITAHLLTWRRVLAARLRGEDGYPVELNSAEDWQDNALLRERGWPTLFTELAANQSELLVRLATLNDSWLALPHNKDYSCGFLLEGVIQHDIYHIGQIGLVLAALKEKSIASTEHALATL